MQHVRFGSPFYVPINNPEQKPQRCGGQVRVGAKQDSEEIRGYLVTLNLKYEYSRHRHNKNQ